jgi:protein-tyrosine phosphatase
VKSDIYWIKPEEGFRLAIMARPRAGDWLVDEIVHWKCSGINTVISLLEPDEVADLGLENEAKLCIDKGIRFISFPIPDRGLPEDSEVKRLLAGIEGFDQGIAIHCRAGIGRSSIIAAAILVDEGMKAAEALTAIEVARGLVVPDTDAQRAWVLKRDAG